MRVPRLKILTSGDPQDPSFGGIVEGVPPGTMIPPGYLSHQLWRIRKVTEGVAWTRTPPDVVVLTGGTRRRISTGAPIVFTIKTRELGTRMMKPLDLDVDVALADLAIPLFGLTIVRKMLEDRSIFIGSRALRSAGAGDPGVAEADESDIRLLLSASCGAYKITEQADRSRERFTRPALVRRARASPRVFEVLLSGPPGWIEGALEGRRRLVGRLVSQLLGLSPVASLSADVQAMKASGVVAIRLRAVLKNKRSDRLVADRRTALLSVLSETLVIPPLAKALDGLTIEGLSPRAILGGI